MKNILALRNDGERRGAQGEKDWPKPDLLKIRKYVVTARQWAEVCDPSQMQALLCKRNLSDDVIHVPRPPPGVPSSSSTHGRELARDVIYSDQSALTYWPTSLVIGRSC